ncbi:Putative leucine-rich repeat receptor-like protein kinase [Glycine soja]|uniref:Putative leucine-rich repeat receptor-like protein kinase n=1 Tax=Glycine soja TaxID=3848 RepID=A0A0B2SL37_GLYSO|nr:Putative leucine-rich repeat receptor-like protein kinase [Glycine soja]
MTSPRSPYLLLATAFFLSFHLSYVVHSASDFQALMSFKASSDPSNKLLSQWNSTSSNPCTWHGVSCSLHNNNHHHRRRVSGLVLEDLNLTGSILPLTFLTELRILSLKRNRFDGPIPSLSNLTALKLLFLSHNKFSGKFPATVTSLPHLYRLDLSYNNLSGQIPATLNNLTHLLTLRINTNNLRGRIPNINNLSHLQDFNVSGNRLSGKIPDSLSGFPGSAFSNNLFLCGVPLLKCRGGETKAIPALASPLKPPNDTDLHHKSKTHVAAPRMGVMVLVIIVLGDVLVLALVSLILYCYFWRNYSVSLKEVKVETHSKSKAVYKRKVNSEGMVFLEGVRRFELEELLCASAEMLGKGVFGTAYKAVLDDGNVVAVKRLKEVSVGGKRELQQRMEVLGRLRHCNVVPLRAYYFAKDEKLLVSDYMPNGNLSWLLHGNRGPGRTPLDWTTRLKLAAGVARGIAFIHNSDNKLTHGNIKSTNVLVDVAGKARVSDFGLSSIFAGPTSSRSNGILTGKCPSAAAEALELPRWVRSVVREEWTAEVFDLELMRYKDIEEEMVALLQIAMACTATVPDQRPRMSHVSKMIEELSGVHVSQSHDALDSVSESPSAPEDACTGRDGPASASQ